MSITTGIPYATPHLETIHVNVQNKSQVEYDRNA